MKKHIDEKIDDVTILAFRNKLLTNYCAEILEATMQEKLIAVNAVEEFFKNFKDEEL